MTTRITINGQAYGSVEEMPPDVRRQYELAMGMLADKNANGIPDILEGKSAQLQTDGGGLVKRSIVSNVMSRIVVNGQEYSHWEDVPPAIRQTIERAGVALHSNPALESTTPALRSATVPLQPGTIQPVPADGGLRIGLVWLVLLLLVAILAGMLIGVRFLR